MASDVSRLQRGSDRLRGLKQHKFPVAIRSGETPVPIPNTTVKTRAAESTILATVWEDRWLPDIKEGWTLYLENRILKEDFNQYNPRLLRLRSTSKIQKQEKHLKTITLYRIKTRTKVIETIMDDLHCL